MPHCFQKRMAGLYFANNIFLYDNITKQIAKTKTVSNNFSGIMNYHPCDSYLASIDINNFSKLKYSLYWKIILAHEELKQSITVFINKLSAEM